MRQAGGISSVCRWAGRCPVGVRLSAGHGTVPLALELAAARLAHFTVNDLSDGLADSLSLLLRPGHGRLDRQQTLAATLEGIHRRGARTSSCFPSEQTICKVSHRGRGTSPHCGDNPLSAIAAGRELATPFAPLLSTSGAPYQRRPIAISLSQKLSDYMAHWARFMADSGARVGCREHRTTDPRLPEHKQSRIPDADPSKAPRPSKPQGHQDRRPARCQHRSLDLGIPHQARPKPGRPAAGLPVLTHASTPPTNRPWQGPWAQWASLPR
jgi:hypothetical protein